MEALRGEEPIAAICRKYGLSESVCYRWNKEFGEAGKKRLAGDTTREATSDEVADLRKENARLKEMVADLMLRYDIRKKKLAILGINNKWRKYMRYSRSRKRRNHPPGGPLRTGGEQNLASNCAFLKARFTIGTKLT